LDSGDMTTNESKELGEILHRLLPAVKSATGIQRVCYLALMERAAQGLPSPLPLIMTRGCPSSFVEMLQAARLLADPGSNGADKRSHQDGR
jgi:hypothetical protein